MIIALMATVCAFAQPEAGTFSITPKVGINVANVTNGSYDKLHKYADSFYNFTAGGIERVGFVAGAEAGYQVSKSFAVTAGLLYSQQGAKRSGYLHGEGASVDDKSQLALSYLNIPILANVYLFKGFSLKAGIQPGILLSAKNKIDVTASGIAIDSDAHAERDVKDNCNSFDFSIPVGISYEFYNVVIDARYNFGLTNITKDSKLEKGEKNGKNGVFLLTVGYKINL